jgi:hypothetical protein
MIDAMRFPSTILLLSLLCAGCSHGTGENGAAPLSEFAGAYAGFLELSARADLDSLAHERAIDSILTAGGMDRALFQKEVQWCNQDVFRWKVVMEEVVRRLEEKQRAGYRGTVRAAPRGGPS